MPLIKFNENGGGNYMDVLGKPNITVKAGETRDVCMRLATSVIKAKKGSLVLKKPAPTEEELQAAADEAKQKADLESSEIADKVRGKDSGPRSGGRKGK